MYLNFIFLSIAVLFAKSSYVTPPAACLPIPDHTAWSAELKKYVSAEGVVHYREWVKQQAGLDDYLRHLSADQPVANWSINVQLAYWINVYNAHTIKMILSHYPVNSIKDLYNGNPWDHAWIKLGSKTYSLNQIENEIIRRQYKDPRIHFALNCAARSCPPLLNEAFEPAKLDAQLTTCTKAFVTNPRFNQTDKAPVNISQLFNWYKEDFKPDVISFLNTHCATPIPLDAVIEYMEYDWRLNE